MSVSAGTAENDFLVFSSADGLAECSRGSNMNRCLRVYLLVLLIGVIAMAQQTTEPGVMSEKD